MLIKLLQVVVTILNLDLAGVDVIEFEHLTCLTQRQIFGIPYRKL